ncbi:type II secretion system F family protein [Methylophilus medardicus]|uniref:Type II secretion system F family protein n=1 Tax=Methylophilus medardicus TaxID=2588534 RepID=A0A5B8CQX8_9PROT|nr:type II secretion system F family protein [Methylophilus medardicus]QDC43426.1 type II secretion system F family protein [Methylophilus medardicus]QDC48433.1 type II secretion system F family protein [Methylophilus medardicus]QDC52138.1 type II secretion system F family protein [Methylophilus medardicus]
MPMFEYKGRTEDGMMVSGVQEAADLDALGAALMVSRITPIEIKQKAAGAMAFNLFEEKVTSLDVMLFSRQMYTLLKAGIPIMRALAGIQNSVGNPKLAQVVGQLRVSLDSGRELSVALTEHPKVFDNFYISMIRVGEGTGNLDNIFLRLAEHIEFERFMRGQIKSALQYPTFVMIAMAIAIVVINVMVIPQFEKVFATMHADLPFITKMLIAFSNFMRNYWFVLIGMMVGAVWTFKSYTSTPAGRSQWDRIKMRIPIAGKIIFKGTMARFARSFALSTRSGLPILSALRLVSQTVENDYIAAKILSMSSGIERGETILRTATQTGVFNSLVLQMIAVGEESGSLDDLMQQIADMYQSDVEYDVKTLGAQIEPILIIFLGILVLILALGVFLPIWDMSSVMLKGS